MGRRKSDRARTFALIGMGILVITTQIICVTISLINSYWTSKLVGVIDLFQQVVEALPTPGAF